MRVGSPEDCCRDPPVVPQPMLSVARRPAATPLPKAPSVSASNAPSTTPSRVSNPVWAQVPWVVRQKAPTERAQRALPGESTSMVGKSVSPESVRGEDPASLSVMAKGSLPASLSCRREYPRLPEITRDSAGLSTRRAQTRPQSRCGTSHRATSTRAARPRPACAAWPAPPAAPPCSRCRGRRRGGRRRRARLLTQHEV